MEWDSKERGYAITENEQTDGLYLGCGVCSHSVRMRWADVLATWGAGTFTRDIARSLKCSACGERRGYIMAWADSRPRWARDAPDGDPSPIVGGLMRRCGRSRRGGRCCD